MSMLPKYECPLCGETVPEAGWYDEDGVLGIDCENNQHSQHCKKGQCGRYDIRKSDWPLFKERLDDLRPQLMLHIRLCSPPRRAMLDKEFLEQIR